MAILNWQHLSYAVQGSDEAVDWLLKNGYPELAALDSAIDGDQKACEWLMHETP
jgi:hypothetical protein